MAASIFAMDICKQKISVCRIRSSSYSGTRSAWFLPVFEDTPDGPSNFAFQLYVSAKDIVDKTPLSWVANLSADGRALMKAVRVQPIAANNGPLLRSPLAPLSDKSEDRMLPIDVR